MDCIVHGAKKSRTRLSDFHFEFMDPFFYHLQTVVNFICQLSIFVPEFLFLKTVHSLSLVIFMVISLNYLSIPAVHHLGICFLLTAFLDPGSHFLFFHKSNNCYIFGVIICCWVCEFCYHPLKSWFFLSIRQIDFSFYKLLTTLSLRGLDFMLFYAWFYDFMIFMILCF